MHKKVYFYQTDIQTFCLTFALTGVQFRGELQQVGEVNKEKIKSRSIKIGEIMISNC